MQNILFKTVLFTATASALVGCKPKLDVPTPSQGDINVSKYVAIGNSITAGYADGALYYQGQTVSYANLLAEQFKLVGGGEFKTPFFPESSVGCGGDGLAPLKLDYKTDCKGVNALAPVRSAPLGDQAYLFGSSVAANGPFNNMGVPGAKVITTVYPGYGNTANGIGNYNPFFTRLLAPSEYATTSILDKAKSQGHTFFSCFIGNNDILGFATSGGTGGGDAVTPIANFSGAYDIIVNAMTANGEKGILATIPDITSLPYFTTVPSQGLVLDAPTAAYLSSVYAPAGISFSAGPNGFIIQDAAAPAGFRKILPTEYLILSTPGDSIKCKGWGTAKPIPAKYVLDAGEISQIRTAVIGYNAKIKAVADAKNLAFVDVNAFLAKAKSGIAYNGINVNATFVSGGAFSLDGVHLSPRGNAMLANEFIKAINEKYSSTIPTVEVTKYAGVKFP